MCIIFSIEGNIGSGKSTLVRKLNKYLKDKYQGKKVIYLAEPVNTWNTIKDSKGNTILAKFYENQHKYAFSFQMMAKIEEINYQIYNKWFDEFVNDVPLSGIIYVKTDPTKCLERVLIRNREGETIPLEYLEMCSAYHQIWLTKTKKTVLQLNGNIEFINEIPMEWIQQIEAFINEKINSSYDSNKNELSNEELNSILASTHGV
jgi:deoxyadenosine/deoxycytidine kinase